MQEFLTNLVLLIYLAIVFIYKVAGYSYFNAAWRALVWITFFIIIALSAWYGYQWLRQEADEGEDLESQQADVNEKSSSS